MQTHLGCIGVDEFVHICMQKLFAGLDILLQVENAC